MRFVFFSAIAEQAEIDEGIDESEYSGSSDEEDAAGLEAAHQHEMRRLAVLKLEARGKVKPSNKKAEADDDAPVPQAKKGGMFSVLSVDEDSVEEPSDESEPETETVAATANTVQSESDSESENSESDEDQSEEKPVKAGKASQSQAVEEKATVLPDGDETLLKNRAQLLDYFFRTRTELELEGPITVGMVGYPNVGKSSTINVLLQDHRVAVSATPGKTRHFQSIHFSEDLVVCDCPGLVFPTFMASRADLVCSGVLPIDQLKVENYVAPVSVVCQRVSRAQFGSQYGLKFPAHARIDAHMLMMTYAKKRGLVAGHGFANEPVSARLILKDYTNGKLLYCHSPPGLTDAERAEFFNSLEQTKYQPEPANQRELADQHAVDEYVGGIGPQTISRRKMRGNTKAKQRLRRDRKLGRTLVPNKGIFFSQH
jgi:large subunit GTPase 1